MASDKKRITVCREARAEIEEKRSVFIGHTAPVSSEEEAREFIQSLGGFERFAEWGLY